MIARRNASGEIDERGVPGWLFPRGDVTPHATLLEAATDYWRAIVGLVIVALVLALPQGIAGFVRSLRERAAS